MTTAGLWWHPLCSLVPPSGPLHIYRLIYTGLYTGACHGTAQHAQPRAGCGASLAVDTGRRTRRMKAADAIHGTSREYFMYARCHKIV